MTRCIACTFDPNKIEEVKDAVRSFASIDADFNGENGKEYLWEEAAGYTSNCDYLIDKFFKNIIYNTKNVIAAFDSFFKEWVGADLYYDEYDYEPFLDNEELIGMAFAVSVRD